MQFSAPQFGKQDISELTEWLRVAVYFGLDSVIIWLLLLHAVCNINQLNSQLENVRDFFFFFARCVVDKGIESTWNIRSKSLLFSACK